MIKTLIYEKIKFMKNYLKYIAFFLLASCHKIEYGVNEVTSDIANFSLRPNSPCCLKYIIDSLAVPMNLDTTVHKWYYYYYGMKADPLVKQVLYIKETSELIGVHLEAYRVLYYYNPNIREMCFERSSIKKDSARVNAALNRVVKYVDSLVLFYDSKCTDSKNY